MNLERIKLLAENKRIPFKKIASDIGMSEGNLHRCVRENKIQASDLEKIADALKVPVSYFFDDADGSNFVESHGEFNATTGRGDASVIVGDGKLAQEVALLKRLLDEKDTLLAEKDARISDLKEIISTLRSH